MSLLFRKKFIWAELETSYGVDPTPTNADSVLTKNLSITPYQGNLVTRDLDRATLGAQTAINTGPNVQVTFQVELQGGGGAATAPGWGKVMQACGFDETITPTTGPVVYDPTDVFGSNSSVTIYFFLDGQRHIVKGARGSVALSLARGEIPVLEFTMLGLYTTPTTTSGTQDVSAFIAPVPVTDSNTPSFALMGYSGGKYERMRIDMANNVVYRNVINGEQVLITDRNPTIEVDVEAEALGTQNWFTDIESHNGLTTGTMSLVHGSGTGKTITITAPAVQLQELSVADSDGIAMYQMRGVLTPSSGNDEVRISIA